MVIEKSGYKFDVEIDATKEYDKTHSVCDCSYCRNYEAQIVEYLPRLKAFFDEVHFGLLFAKENVRLVCFRYTRPRHGSLLLPACCRSCLRLMGDYDGLQNKRKLCSKENESIYQ